MMKVTVATCREVMASPAMVLVRVCVLGCARGGGCEAVLGAAG